MPAKAVNIRLPCSKYSMHDPKFECFIFMLQYALNLPIKRILQGYWLDHARSRAIFLTSLYLVATIYPLILLVNTILNL